jgi:signal transduction histidine kinase
MLGAAGIAWFVGDFEHALNRDVALAGFALSKWQGWFLALAVLSFPSGHLQFPRDRVITGLIAVALGLRTLGRVFLHVPPDVAGYGTENRFLPITDDRWWRAAEDAFAWVYPTLIVATALSVAAHWARSSRPGRRMLSPALLAGAVLAAATGYEHVIGWNAGGPRLDRVRIVYVVNWAHAAVALALAVGFVRLRQTRSAVVDLIAELGEGPAPDRLGDALARALGDDSLQLVTWSDTVGRYVDARLRPIELPDDERGRAVTLIERQGAPVAALIHDVALREDPGLVNAIVAAVRLTIDNDRLASTIEEQLAEVAASRSRMLAAGDEERRRIERDLHDGAQQRLVAIALALRLAETRLDSDSPPDVRQTLTTAVRDLSEAVDELRDLARGIHPAILTESGLGAALRALVDRSPLPVTLDLSLAGEPAAPIAATAYFAVSEALTNVAKHARAGHVSVRAATRVGAIRIEIADDGVGGADDRAGTGLRGIADRVATMGGTLAITSAAGGTRVEIELPCGS